MDELPSLALVAVLGCLPFEDLIRCRRVSKLWRHLIDHTVSKLELILFVETRPRPNWWEFNGEAVNLEHSVQANYSVFTSKPFFTMFRRIRRLFLSFNHFAFSQKLTNNLASNFGDTLEHLQIDFHTNGSLVSNREFKLSLNNLLSFSFSKKIRFESYPKDFNFSLDCNRLTHLYANSCLTNESKTMFARVASNLKVLFAADIFYEERIEFPNLEVLGCYEAPDTQFLVSCLPSLKEFHFLNSFPQSQTIAQRSINEFLGRIESEKRKVDVFWLGIKFTLKNSDRIFQFQIFAEKFGVRITSLTLDCFKENASTLNFKYLRYTGDYPVVYLDSFGDQLDEDLDQKLISDLAKILHTVFMYDVHRPLDELRVPNLFQFVSKLLVTKDLKQPDLDALPRIFPHLRVFQWRGMPTRIVDFSFVSRFKNLCLCSTRMAVPLASLDQMLTDCPHLNFVSFPGKEKAIYIQIFYRHLMQSDRRFGLGFKPNSRNLFYFKEKEELLGFLDINDLVIQEKSERNRKRMKVA